jgi:hypothetical protein
VQERTVKDENMVERLAMMDMSPLQDHTQPAKHKKIVDKFSNSDIATET